jgi:4,5-dihydroxyphthalate decarboxylase
MMPLHLRTNLADSRVTAALKDGRVAADGITFDFCGPAKARNGFRAMLNEGAFDAGEMALMTLLQARAYGRPFVLLPVPLSGRFQHHTIGYNSRCGDLAPRDIEGRKVGLRTWSQTTSVWIKGVLAHEYGVDLDAVTWLTKADAHLPEHRDPPCCQRLPAEADLGQMLLSGEMPAAILGSQLPDEPFIRPLIPDPHAAARDWFLREQVVPINTLFIVHEDIARRDPGATRALFDLLVQSRAADPEADARLAPTGAEALHHTLDLAIQWSFEQQVIPRRLAVEELYGDCLAMLA